MPSLVVVHSIQIGLDPVRVGLEKARQLRRHIRPRNIRRADQPRDHRRQRRRRVARVLLPALLLRHRRIAHQERRRALDKRKHVELAQPVQLPQPPRQHDRKRHLIQLNARPVRRSVDPEVLREAPIRPLRTRQIHQRAPRRIDAPAGQQRRRRLHHVARPHQVIPAQIVVALRRSPRNRRRRNERARVRLVLMRQQHILADPQQLPAVHRGRPPAAPAHPPAATVR